MNQIPTELLQLQDFQKKSNNWYSEGFQLSKFGNDIMFKTYSKDKTFLASLIEFAIANGSGSVYAFWTSEDKNLSTAPIVIFGDEGGYHVVAENIKQLFSILTYDAEPMVSWDKVVYSKYDENKSSARKDEFRNWLHDTFQVSATKDPNSIVENAQKTYKEKFQNWMKEYLK